MLTAMVAAIVGFSTRWPRVVVAAAALLTVLCGVYAAANSRHHHRYRETAAGQNLPWRQSQAAYASVFPQNQIVVVVEASTPEMVELAAARLEAGLRERQDVLGAVRRPDGGAFFERNGLLFMPTGEVADTARKFREAQPVLGLLASDPSLRGVTQTLMVGVDAVQNRKAPVTALLPPMNMLSATLEDVFAGRFATMSWRALLMGQPAVDGGAGEAGSPARAFLTVDPKLDYNELQPGRAATDAIRQAAQAENLPGEFGARVRLTGQVPIGDEQFSALSNMAGLHFAGTVLAVLVILWLALRSGRIILAGLPQPGGRLRRDRRRRPADGRRLQPDLDRLHRAVHRPRRRFRHPVRRPLPRRAPRFATTCARLRSAATKAGRPLTLAAAGAAVGFFSFLPTAYRGVAELGLIAGVGMVIAFPRDDHRAAGAADPLRSRRASREPMGFAALAPVDRFLARHRYWSSAARCGRAGRHPAALPPALRLRPDPPAGPERRGGRHLPGAERRSPTLGLNAANSCVPSVARFGR